MFDLRKISKIRRAPIRNEPGYKAPHKPILLLSIIWLIDQQKYTDNKFYLDQNITSIFKKLWMKLVTNKAVHPKIFLPFYHLSKDNDIWYLNTVNSESLNLTLSYSPKSLSSLMDSIEYASLNTQLFNDLSNREKRVEIWHYVLKAFFPDSSSFSFKDIKTENVYNTLERDLFEVYSEPKDKYWREVELISRNSYFKKRIPEIYNFTCAVTELRLSEPYQRTLLDACHIEPWSKRYNDSIRNGICLTPTAHRAFDNYLFTISEKYEVVLPKDLSQRPNARFDFAALQGKRIFLPEDERLYPNQDFLELHRETFYTKRS